MKFDPNASPACYRSASSDEIIQPDTKVRMQLVGCRVEANDIVSYSTVLRRNPELISPF
jgi:DNA-directed RNA polymerase II subunit RPB7